MEINAHELHFKDLNDQIKASADSLIHIENCMGQRYIGSGLSEKEIHIKGTPGNALGAYLNGSTIRVYGNGQDATGDTMNEGNIFIHGLSGDATGYAMRGGKIFIKGNAGYRAGIHMKAYEDKVPVLVIGGKVGSFLGEYQAGGTIIVLGLEQKEDEIPVGPFCSTGMHGGKIFIRSEKAPTDLPAAVIAKKATSEDLKEIEEEILLFCKEFGFDKNEILSKDFQILEPDTKNPYKQLYTHN
jgi:glutamate synthase domain-containing protein 3